jgi:hypothetical protein
MELPSETTSDEAKELQRANSHIWGGDKVTILHIGWLKRPAQQQREISIVIELTSPVIANHAINFGVIWDNQIHQAVRFCRDGRSKPCKRCQKPGHIQSHCPNDPKCSNAPKGT